MSKNILIEGKNIALLDNELIVREEIRINELSMLFPDVLIPITRTIYTHNKDYVINGLDNIILKVDIPDNNGKLETFTALLQDYFSVYLINDEEHKSKDVFMRITDKEGKLSWLHNWFRLDHLYKYDRPNVWDVPEMFTHLEFMKMRNVPIDKLEGYYKIEINFDILIPVPMI